MRQVSDNQLLEHRKGGRLSQLMRARREQTAFVVSASKAWAASDSPAAAARHSSLTRSRRHTRGSKSHGRYSYSWKRGRAFALSGDDPRAPGAIEQSEGSGRSGSPPGRSALELQRADH